MKKNYINFRSGIKNFLIGISVFPLLMNAQNSYTFTSAGATGPLGPTQSQINTAYASTNLNGSVTVSGGIQTFTVPVTGPYRITAIGAQGAYNGGSPASIRGDFTLTAGTVLKILVGQTGTQASNGSSYIAGGGGGGSFITSTLNVPYIVAGGGGGNGDGYSGVPVTCCLNGMEAATVTAGNPYPSGSNGGSAGNGGTCGSPTAGGGAGIYGNGNSCSSNSAPLSYTNGGTGGYGGGSPTSGDGGFGGGAGGYNSGVGQRGGGGGGYSGGGGGTANSGNDAAGGGGGSYNNGANQLNSVSTSTGNGKVIIDLLCFLNVTAATPNPTAPAICSGNSTTLTVNAVSGYSWSTGATTNSIVVSPTSSQTYSVTGTSTAGCSTSAFITVTVSSAAPVLTITASSNSLCLGRTVTLTATGGLTYTWTNGIINGQAYTPGAGVNVYTVTTQNGCGIATGVTTVSVSSLPVTTLATPTIVCAGNPATLTAASAVSGYTWQPIGPTGANVVVSPTATTVFTVTASDGTCSGTATLNLAVKATPTITAFANTSLVCQGDPAVLSATGGINYTWTPGTNLTGATVTVNPTSPTAYQVVGSNSLGCTSTSGTFVLTNPSPTVSISANQTLVCSGNQAVLTASGATQYNWTNGPGNAVYTVTPSGTTVYTVTGIDSNCSDTETITISVFSPSVNVTASSASICLGSTATLTASSANTYTWSNSLGTTANVTVSPGVTSTYTVSAKTTSAGVSCPSSNNITITVFNNPTISIVATKTVMCKKDAGPKLTASGGVSYAWDNATTNSTLIVSPSATTNYTVTGTDANGCVNTATIQIKVNPCTGIDELSASQNMLTVYPNPNNGEFTVRSNAEMSLKVINELGQEVRTLTLSNQNSYTMPVNDLPIGIYFIVGQNGSSKVNQKVVVTK